MGTRAALIGLVVAIAACNAFVGWDDLELKPSSSPSSSTSIKGPLDIGLGLKHACGSLEDLTVACWGANEHGQLGLGHTDNVLTPTRVPKIEKMQFLSVGRSHTCVTVEDGSVYCWGSNENAQLGIGPADTDPHPEPVKVDCSPAKKVQASKGHTCIETLTKTIECWGANQHGQLGDGTTTQKSGPVRVPGLTGVEKLSAGNGDFTCAVASRGDGGAGDAVYCWGLNDKGQLGQPLSLKASPVPLVVPGLADPDKVFIGQEHACATLSDTTVQCWGANTHGQLGDGTAAARPTPAPVKGVIGMTEVAPGFSHTCGNEGSGVAKCWGSNEYGQLGLGAKGDDRLSPTKVPGDGWEGVTTDGNSSCGRRGGINYCWGRNDQGQLGNGTTDDTSEPTPLKLE